MKKILIGGFLLALVSCNSEGGNKEGDTGSSDFGDTSSKQIRGVENVNGNIPDTTNTGAKPSKDSTDQ
ncbi:MAG TPA: hypothetical protein VHK69_15485 [Chitinophagaceae bacterium]|jgi:hypothetical protein|nr:hypothetical protein [Chitinophagaceae bacterium]